jgi:hypothetical protein
VTNQRGFFYLRITNKSLQQLCHDIGILHALLNIGYKKVEEMAFSYKGYIYPSSLEMRNSEPLSDFNLRRTGAGMMSAFSNQCNAEVKSLRGSLRVALTL